MFDYMFIHQRRRFPSNCGKAAPKSVQRHWLPSLAAFDRAIAQVFYFSTFSIFINCFVFLLTKYNLGGIPGSGRSNIAISPKRVVIEENIDNNNIKKSKIVLVFLKKLFKNLFWKGKKQKKSESKGLLSFFKRKKSQPNIDKNENENDDENDDDDDEEEENNDVVVEEEEKQDNDKKDDTNDDNKDDGIVENQSEV